MAENMKCAAIKEKLSVAVFSVFALLGVIMIGCGIISNFIKGCEQYGIFTNPFKDVACVYNAFFREEKQEEKRQRQQVNQFQMRQPTTQQTMPQQVQIQQQFQQLQEKREQLRQYLLEQQEQQERERRRELYRSVKAAIDGTENMETTPIYNTPVIMIDNIYIPPQGQYKYNSRHGSSGNYTYNYDVYDLSGTTANCDIKGKYGDCIIENEYGTDKTATARWIRHGVMEVTDEDGNIYEMTP